MKDILLILPFVLLSYVLIFIAGRIWQKEKMMAEQEEIRANRARWTKEKADQ